MYTLKSYFYVQAEKSMAEQVVKSFKNVKLVENALVSTEAEEKAMVLEIGGDVENTAENLAEAFTKQSKEFWLEPDEIDFSKVLPKNECNSFVLVVYGNIMPVEALVEKWQELSWKYCKKILPIVASCRQDGDVRWAEFRSHSTLADAIWFADVRKISAHFTKSQPTFYKAEKLF